VRVGATAAGAEPKQPTLATLSGSTTYRVKSWVLQVSRTSTEIGRRQKVTGAASCSSCTHPFRVRPWDEQSHDRSCRAASTPERSRKCLSPLSHSVGDRLARCVPIVPRVDILPHPSQSIATYQVGALALAVLACGPGVRAAWHRTICPSRQSCTSACARIAFTGAVHGCRTFAQATCRVRSGGWSRQTGARAKSTGWSPIASGVRAIGGSANGACRVHERERSLNQGPWSDQRAPARTRRPFLRGVLPAWIPSCVGTNKPSMVMRRGIVSRIVRRKELRS